MKKLLFLTIAFLFSVSAISQVVNIPDANFKSTLLANTAINTNADEEIQVSEAESYSGSLNIDRSKGVIVDFTGLEAFLNLSELGLEGHSMTDLYLTANNKLERLTLGSLEFIKNVTLPENSILNFIQINNTYGISSLDFSKVLLLKDLEIAMGSPSILDLSKNSNLERLSVSESPISSLNISNNPMLQTLSLAMSGGLKTIDLSGAANLKTVSISDSYSIEQLDFSNNSKLTQLIISEENLSSLNVKNGNNINLSLSVSSPILKCVIVDDVRWSKANWSTKFPQGTQFSLDCIPEPVVNIPDSGFKAQLLLNTLINTNIDEEIQVSEAEVFSGKLVINENDITPIMSLVGLEAFIGLKELQVRYCSELPAIDITKNANLEKLFLEDTNGIINLDVSQNKLLKVLFLSNTGVSGFIDLSGNTELESVDVIMSGIGGLNVTNCKKLKSLNLNMSGINSLDVSQNPLLEYLDVSDTTIPTLDITQNPNLKTLIAERLFEVSEVDLSKNSQLNYLMLSGDNLTYLNLKNGNNINFQQILIDLSFSGISQLKCVIVDDPIWSKANWLNFFPQGTQFSLDCIPEPVVNIPDANFKSRLLSIQEINKNLDNEIQVSEAENYSSWLIIGDANISDLTGLEYFKNITELNCNYNNISSIDLTGFNKLKKLNCTRNNLTDLNLSGLTNIETIDCSYNKIQTLDLTGLTKLWELSARNNQLTSIKLNEFKELRILDLNSNLLEELDINENNQLNVLDAKNNKLTYVNIKNGKEHWFGVETFYESNAGFNNNPNLKYICADESEIIPLKYHLNQIGLPNCEVNSYCTFTPGGEFYTLKGKLTRCDSEELFLPNVKYAISNGTNSGYFIADATGNYSITVTDKTHLITPKSEYSEYFEIAPAFANIEFSDEQKVIEQDFCIKNIKEINDVEIVISPIEVARPGFDADYEILYTNKGTTTSKGTIEFGFEDSILDYLGATAGALVTEGKVSWNYEGLKPFETRKLYVKFNLNSPMEIPAVNNDDILKFTARINTEVEDTTPKDNQFDLHQTVVGSFDPNDKTCLEGEVITPDMIGNYLHYKIRFENTGTFAAENVVIEDDIDTTKFDLSSLVVLEGSHPFVTKIEGNKVKFIFEKINLPFDDATNDGHVLFKIKTLPSLKLNDSFSNSAKIYFDFNFPIETNLATTTVKENIGLSVKDFEFSDQFNLYPNPTNNELNISAKTKSTITSIEIYNTIGQILLAIPNAQNMQKIDVSFLPNGTYILKANTSNGVSTIKFVKE